MARPASLQVSSSSMDGGDPRFARALVHLRSALDGAPRATGMTPPDPAGWWPTGEGDDLARMRTMSRALASFARTVERRSVPSWPDHSDCLARSGDAARLIALRRRLRGIREASASVAPLLRAQFLRLAGAPPRVTGPDAVGLQVLAVSEAESQLAAAVAHLDAALATLKRAIQVALHRQDTRIRWTGTGS